MILNNFICKFNLLADTLAGKADLKAEFVNPAIKKCCYISATAPFN